MKKASNSEYFRIFTGFVWTEGEGFEPSRVLTPKRFSRPPRYDHFANLPSIFEPHALENFLSEIGQTLWANINKVYFTNPYKNPVFTGFSQSKRYNSQQFFKTATL